MENEWMYSGGTCPKCMSDSDTPWCPICHNKEQVEEIAKEYIADLRAKLARKDKGLSRLILAVDKLNQTRTDRSPLEMITAWNAVWSAIDIAQKTLD